MVLIHFQIPGGPDLQIKKPVAGKGSKHVSHKTNRVVQPGLTAAVKIKSYQDIRFSGCPFNFSAPRHSAPSVFNGMNTA
jgi:hypothetical protein